MRIELRQVHDALEAARSAGDEMGRRIAALVTDMEALGHFDNRPSDQDRDLCEEMLETLVESIHFEKAHGDDSDARYVAKCAARRFWTASMHDADRDLRLAKQAYLDAHWYDHLDDLRADELAEARA
jgi:hypothetical protein